MAFSPVCSYFTQVAWCNLWDSTTISMTCVIGTHCSSIHPKGDEGTEEPEPHVLYVQVNCRKHHCGWSCSKLDNKNVFVKQCKCRCSAVASNRYCWTPSLGQFPSHGVGLSLLYLCGASPWSSLLPLSCHVGKPFTTSALTIILGSLSKTNFL